MDIELSKPQAEFFKSEAKATAVVAGYGSGKTEITMFRLISSVLEYPEGDWLYCAPTIPLVRDILWAKLASFLPSIGLSYTLNKSESIVYIHGYGKIFCRSMDNPDRIIGFEVVDAFLDEIDILPTEKARQVYLKVKARCRQLVVDKAKTNGRIVYKKNQIFLSTTPEGYKFSYETFKKNPVEDTTLITMSTRSNIVNLPEDYISDLMASYPPQLIAAYIEGEFTNLNSLGVWIGFDSKLNHYNTLARPGEQLHIGQDYNIGRGCAVIYVRRMLPANDPKNATKEPLQAMIAVGEVVDSFDTPDTVRALDENFPKSTFGERIIYPDATGQSRKSVNASITDIAVMRNAGFTIKTANQNPPIKDRVICSNAAFCNADMVRKVFVNTEACPNLTEALEQQAYDKNGLPEKGVGKHDDTTDSATYPIYHFFPIKHNRMYQTTVGGL